MAGLLDWILPTDPRSKPEYRIPKAYTHYDGWVPPQQEVRAPYKPRNTVAERAQSVFGMDPKVRRLGFLPYPKGALGKGPIDWSDWAAPEILHSFAKGSVLPGHALQGGHFTPDDVTRDVGLNVAGLGYAAGGLIAPKGALGMGGTRPGIGHNMGPPIVDEIGPVYQSRLKPAIEGMPQEKMTADQAAAHFKKYPGGVGADELEWSGIQGLLGAGGTVTKSGLLAQYEENPLVIEDVTKTSHPDDADDALNFGEGVVDDAYDAYSHRSEDIRYEMDSGEDYYLDSVIDIMSDQSPVKYPKGDQAWANNIRNAVNEGRLGDLDQTTDWDLNEAIDKIAKDEYMDNPYRSWTDNEGLGYEIYGSDDIGYSIKSPEGQHIGGDIYNFEEAQIQARQHAWEEGHIAGAAEDAPQWSDWQLPGGENYREVLLTTGPRLENYPTREAYNEAIRQQEARGGAFTEGHYDEANVLAHARMNTRKVDGDRTLFIEEIQSDWHQKGQKRGYKRPISEGNTGEARKALFEKLETLDPDSAQYAATERQYGQMVSEVEQRGVPDAPFKKNWHDLAFKRMIREAADTDHQRIAWTSGKTQADRYNLRKHIDELIVEKEGGKFSLSATVPGGGLYRETRNIGVFAPEKLDEVVGKDLAEKIRKQEADGDVYDAKDLKVGGEFHKILYDKKLVQSANKFAKKYGEKVQVKNLGRITEDDVLVAFNDDKTMMGYLKWVKDEKGIKHGSPEYEASYSDNKLMSEFLGRDKDQVWSLKITPEMRRDILKGGVALSGAGLLYSPKERQSQ